MITTSPKTEPIDFAKRKELRAKTATTESNDFLPADFMSGISYNELKEVIDATILGILYKTPGFIEALTATAATTEEEKTMAMDYQEKYLDKLDRDIGDMKSSLRGTEERIAGMINQTLGEMRDRDNQRHTEFLALRSDNAETRRWVIGMVIGAIGVAIAAIIGIVSVVIGN